MDLVTINSEDENTLIQVQADAQISEFSRDPCREGSPSIHIGLTASDGLNWVSGQSVDYTNIEDSDDGSGASFRLNVACRGSTNPSGCFVGRWYDNARSRELTFVCEIRVSQ